MGCCGWKHTDKAPTVPPPRPTPADDLVARHRAAAETALAAATGGEPVCRIGPDRVAAVEQAEGRLAALADVQRSLRNHDCTPPVEVASGLATTWRDGAVSAETRGPVWLAYRRGGADALDALTVELETLDADLSPTR